MPKTLFILILNIIFSPLLQAQMREVPVQRFSKKPAENNQTTRTEALVLNLPFWDDFSISENTPSPLRWEQTNGVWINSGGGLNPPSIMMATFDGLNALGVPYSIEPNEDGLTDVLTSLPINLSPYSITDQVMLSFFVQARGNGEIPNNEDSIQVQFKKLDGMWVNVWSLTGKAAKLDTFDLAAIQVDQQDFLHDNFQFRIRSFGRQSGPFDSWHIDYVYLNSGVSDFNFPDRALQTRPSSPFRNYTGIPVDHYSDYPSYFEGFSTASAYNLFDQLQPSNFTIIAYIDNINKDLSLVSTIDTLAWEFPSSFPIPNPISKRRIELTAPSSLNPAKIQSDSLSVINLKLYMNTDDNVAPDFNVLIYDTLDFRINDTIKAEYALSDYYAYDDGTAEYAAGLNYIGNKVACRFDLPTDLSDTIVAVDLYFPNFRNDNSRLIDMQIWNSKEGKPNALLFEEPLSIQASSEINQYHRYLLKTPVVVKDTFFIGWEHVVDGNIDMGLDKNTDTGNRMYFHLGDQWQQNFSVKGSLMMRPVFGSGSLITSAEQISQPTLNVYPNPGTGLFEFNYAVQYMQVLDISGRKIAEYSDLNGFSQVDLRELNSGLYILQLQTDQFSTAVKVQIRR